MKNRAKELNVDFIGVQNKPMTKDEQLSITAFIKQLKESRNKKARRKTARAEKQPA